jgi:hypothetical protein
MATWAAAFFSFADVRISASARFLSGGISLPLISSVARKNMAPACPFLAADS